MLPYLILNIIVIMLALILFGFNKNITLNTKTFGNGKHCIFIILSFISLLYLSAFRGDFTSDYKHYVNLFHYYNSFSFDFTMLSEVYQEPGYVILNWITGLITQNAISMIAISSAIILYAHFKQFKNYSVYIWLSVLLFINIGPYYDSFNITRQIMASSIIFLGSKYLYERSFFKYVAIVLVAMSFHRTSVFLIPFYFVLNMKFDMKKVLVLLSLSSISSLYLGYIIQFIQRFFYGAYTAQSYGMSGLKFTNVIIPIAITVFVIFNKSKLDTKNNVERIWINSSIFYTFFSILGLNVQMIQRMSYFFLPYVLMLIPTIVSKVKPKELRAIIIMLIIILLVLYNYITLSGTGYDPYSFIWNR